MFSAVVKRQSESGRNIRCLVRGALALHPVYRRSAQRLGSFGRRRPRMDNTCAVHRFLHIKSKAGRMSCFWALPEQSPRPTSDIGTGARRLVSPTRKWSPVPRAEPAGQLHVRLMGPDVERGDSHTRTLPWEASVVRRSHRTSGRLKDDKPQGRKGLLRLVIPSVSAPA